MRKDHERDDGGRSRERGGVGDAVGAVAAAAAADTAATFRFSDSRRRRANNVALTCSIGSVPTCLATPTADTADTGNVTLTQNRRFSASSPHLSWRQSHANGVRHLR
ncbi:hypothetical protein HN011_009214 [Eciton burchellii]|nr:hypothetical protein HN011_009214 [Eciton burchellii]